MTLEKIKRKSSTWIVCLAIIISAMNIACFDNKKKTEIMTDETDLLELIYSVADELDMKVMCDIDLRGGDLYKKETVEKLTHQSNLYIKEYYKKYGGHPSFWGWYLNNEINPIENSDHEQSAFWRAIWKSIVDKCHEVSPGTKITVSPFFLLDKESLRGFKYLAPQEYEEWWYHTMCETGIDILMLQDSGAEHLSFFTLEDRRPFFAAFANACKRAGKEFWVNVETGQVKATDWDHALKMEKDFNRNWEFTEISWLKQKLELAAEYGTGIINWGYYPLMNPLEEQSILSIHDIDGQEVNLSQRKANYDSYREYSQTISTTIEEGKKTLPKINGTLWFLPSIDTKNSKDLKEAVKKEIMNQKELGFTFLWICNTPSYFQVAPND